MNDILTALRAVASAFVPGIEETVIKAGRRIVMSDEEKKKLLSLINRRERQLLVHSYIYYELDDNIISDETWSKWAFELVELREKHSDIFMLSEYASYFLTFDGSTGYDLMSGYTRPEIVNKALYLLRIENKRAQH